jgi:DNA (cytosine-5)-methyltransferase 1
LRQRTVISLFSGALGLDLGLERAGFRIQAAVECDRHAAQTIRINRPEIVLLEKDIRVLSTKEILEAASLDAGEVDVITGGPSCQTFSTAGQRTSLGDPRGGLFKEFLRIVREAQPRFFVLENVRGILSAAVTHRPLCRRGPGYPPLKHGEVLGSALKLILSEIECLGYRVIFDLINTADYGVPQVRQRVLFLGSRDGEQISMPEATREQSHWVTLRQALEGATDPSLEFIRLPPGWAKYVKLVPEGGNWRDLPSGLQKNALGKAFESWGGRSGFFRRLSWDKPTPALTTRPNSKATLLCHPEELRPLSVSEYARIQQFPDDWVFAGSTSRKYEMIGNAVPLGLGEAIGKRLVQLIGRRKSRFLCRTVICANEELGKRVAKPHTILNPTRMRKTANIEAARRWLRRSLYDAAAEENGPVSSKHPHSAQASP